MKSKGSSDFCCSVSAVKIRPKEGDTYFDVVAVVDPVTRDAQKLAPLLLVGCRVPCHVDAVHTNVLPFIVLRPPSVSPLAGSQEAGQRQPARFHELPVEAVGDASEEVRALTSLLNSCTALSLNARWIFSFTSCFIHASSIFYWILEKALQCVCQGLSGNVVTFVAFMSKIQCF